MVSQNHGKLESFQQLFSNRNLIKFFFFFLRRPLGDEDSSERVEELQGYGYFK